MTNTQQPVSTDSADLSWIDDITMTALERNPYPSYERLRREAPLAFVPVLGTYVASTAEICREIAMSEEFEAVITPAGGRTFGHPAIIGVNGDIHADLRGMVEPQLQPVEVDKFVDDLVRPIARRYLEAFEDNGRAELVADYCEPVSVRSLGDLLGLQSVSSDELRDWFHKLSNSFTNAGVDENGEFTDPERFAKGDQAKEEIRAIVDPLIDEWIENPADTAISHWLHDGMPAGETRERDYIYPTIYVYLLGAMQEPGHGLASTLVGLFSRPEQMEEVVDEPNLIQRLRDRPRVLRRPRQRGLSLHRGRPAGERRPRGRPDGLRPDRGGRGDLQRPRHRRPDALARGDARTRPAGPADRADAPYPVRVLRGQPYRRHQTDNLADIHRLRRRPARRCRGTPTPTNISPPANGSTAGSGWSA